MLACPCHTGVLVLDGFQQRDCNVKALVAGVSKFLLISAEGQTLPVFSPDTMLLLRCLAWKGHVKLEEDVGCSVDKP